MRRSAFVPYQTGKALSEQVSGTLDKVLLFSGYDKQIRPGVSGIFEYTGSVLKRNAIHEKEVRGHPFITFAKFSGF